MLVIVSDKSVLVSLFENFLKNFYYLYQDCETYRDKSVKVVGARYD